MKGNQRQDAETPGRKEEVQESFASSRPLITVATFDNTEQAELLKGRLEQAGIQAFVADGAVVSLNWMYAGAGGGVKVQVSEADVDRVNRLLGEWNERPEGSPALSQYECPTCGSIKVEFRRH